MNITNALYAIRPGADYVLRGNEYSGLEWRDAVQTKPTEQDINDEIAKQNAERPFNECKAKAKQLIAATNWAVLPDVGLKNSADYVTYRGILRGLIITPVAEPVWPTEPTPVWE